MALRSQCIDLCLESGFWYGAGALPTFERSSKPKILPTVMTQGETKRFLDCVAAQHALPLGLMYGSGLRIGDAIRLRVKDLHYEEGMLVVRDGKGGKDRRTVFPQNLMVTTREHLKRVKLIFEKDMEDGCAGVYLPNQLEKKYPSAPKEWIWQYVFPAAKVGIDPRSGLRRRHHISRRPLAQEVKRAAKLAGIHKRVIPHTLCHCLLFFASLR